MLLQRSKLAVTVAERPRLAPPWLIMLLGTMVLAVLVLIYPHQDLITRILNAPSGEITDAYLTNLLRTDTQNPLLRIAMARKELISGHFERVSQTLAPALNSEDPKVKQDAVWLLWQSEEIQYQRLPLDSPKRQAVREQLLRQLAETAGHELPIQMLAELARKAISRGDMKLGSRLFDRLASSEQINADYWYVDAARVALQHGEYRAAAEFYLVARKRAKNIDEQRRFFVAAMHALESGNRITEALSVAESELEIAPGLFDDTETLILLVRFARAAHRPDLADKYARRLLRLSLFEQLRKEQRRLSGLDVILRRVALSANEIGNQKDKGPQLPFDDKIYTLGFEAFLDNRKLEDAWMVAASAVRQAPDKLAWRERLARVSEWAGRPKIALDNWLYLARSTGRDDAWQAVLRLAPGLFDDNALRSALEYQLEKQPGNQKLIRETAAMYERLADPRGGLRFLERTHSRIHQTWVLEDMAELAGRIGDPELALGYWQRFLAQAGLTPERAVRVATAMLLFGRAEESLALLQKTQNLAVKSDVAYWRLTAKLAEFAHNDGLAIKSYRQFVDAHENSAQAEESDYEALYRLLQDGYPQEAAQIALVAWKHFHTPKHLIQALGYYAKNERWQEMGPLLSGLADKDRRLLRVNPEFLQLSAQYALNTGKPTQAKQDLEAAIRLAPRVQSIQLALLWLYIDSGDDISLRRLLSQWERDWQGDPALHDALGSAYLALSLPDIALRRYYTPHLHEHRDDFLWMMNYADALEQNQETDRAWQLRQYLLAQERQRSTRRAWLSDFPDEESRKMRQVARARLVIAQKQGDAGLAVLRELLRLDRDGEKKLSSPAKDVALGWLQEQGSYQAERGWLWQQYARTAARPLWAEISLALAENDRETAGQLLERHGERLPRYDRISAARLGDDLRLAQSDAFQTLDSQHADDPLHLQLSEALLEYSDSVGSEFFKRDIGKIEERESKLHWHVAISPRLALDMSLGSIKRNNRDLSIIGALPDEKYLSARLRWRHPDGETLLTVQQRDSFDVYYPLLLEHTQRIDDRLSLNLALGSELPASDSTALMIAGMKDSAALGLRYRLTARDQISVLGNWSRYYVQGGMALGTGQSWLIEARHAIRTAPRDLEISAFWSDHRYNRRASVNDERLRTLLPAGTEITADVGSFFFIPEDFCYYGIRLSTDTRFEREYTRAWRPYATIARTWNTSLGPGYDFGGGVAGSVFGADHLSIGWKIGKGGSSGSGQVKEFGLTYRLHY